MYQEISSIDGFLVYLTVVLVFAIIVLVLFMHGVREKSRKSLISGSIGSVITIVIMIVGFGPAITHDDVRYGGMEQNILEKYNAKYSGLQYLLNVERSGSGGKTGGHYFDLTYGNETIEKVKFYFNYETGEPKCFCDLKQF